VYSPIKEPAILLSATDLFMDTSYYMHDVSKIKPDTIPVLDRDIYVNKSYRANLQTATHIAIPDDPKYYPVDADNYSAFVNDFIAMNIPKYKIYIGFPALYSYLLPRPDGSPSLRIDTNRFKLIPAGLTEEVVLKNSTERPNIQDFNFQFSNDFPQKKPVLVENVNKKELDDMTVEYAYAYSAIGDYYLASDAGKAENFYHKAYAMNPHSSVTLSKLGIYFIQHNQPEKALEYFTQGEEIYPNDVNWLFSIAVADGMLGKTDEAKTLLEQVIARTQNNPPLHTKATNVLNQLQPPITNK
jgi:tetratricopeptide (TPR) repeat protein